MELLREGGGGKRERTGEGARGEGVRQEPKDARGEEGETGVDGYRRHSSMLTIEAATMIAHHPSRVA